MDFYSPETKTLSVMETDILNTDLPAAQCVLFLILKFQYVSVTKVSDLFFFLRKPGGFQ